MTEIDVRTPEEAAECDGNGGTWRSAAKATRSPSITSSSSKSHRRERLSVRESVALAMGWSRLRNLSSAPVNIN